MMFAGEVGNDLLYTEITFRCPEAPDYKIPCDALDFDESCTPEKRCGCCNDGWLLLSESPEFAYSSQVSRHALTLLGLSDDFSGEIEIHELSGLHRMAMYRMNCTPVGLSLEVRQWFHSFLNLLKYALTHKLRVCWY